MKRQHTMRLVRDYESGAQEWVCDECDRHFAMQADPFKRIIFKPGNDLVAHTGGTVGAGMSVEVKRDESGEMPNGSETLH